MSESPSDPARELPALPADFGLQAAWDDQGALNLTFQSFERPDQRALALRKAMAALMVVGAGIFGAGSSLGAAVAILAWLVGAMTRVTTTGTASRAVVVMFMDMILLAGASGLGPEYLAVATVAVLLGEAADFQAPSLQRHSRTRLTFDGRTLRWGHALAEDPLEAEISLDHHLPAEALEPALIHTQNGSALELTRELRVPVDPDQVAQLTPLVQWIADTAARHRRTAGPLDAGALRELEQLARSRPRRPGILWRRWWAPLAGAAGLVAWFLVGGLMGTLTPAAALAWLVVITPMSVRRLTDRDQYSDD